MEEEREDKRAVSGGMIVQSVFEERRLAGAWLSLDPEQTLIAGGPGPVCLVFKQPPACPLNATANFMGAILHLRKGQRFEAIMGRFG
jgi:hypothetical protein